MVERGRGEDDGRIQSGVGWNRKPLNPVTVCPNNQQGHVNAVPARPFFALSPVIAGRDIRSVVVT